MKNKLIIYTLTNFFISLLVFSIQSAQATGGRTNSEGCHNSKKAGYHCHNKSSKRTKIAKKKVQSFKSDNSEFNCTPKYCTRMRSCAEAYYHLNQCGEIKRDADRDGIPCENICPGG